jgi:asparagine synthase (glutamine-hydrolysing)
VRNSMCGIVGSILLTDQYRSSVDEVIQEKMIESIRHRGPDDSGSWQNDKIFLGMRRLSIIDLNNGQQPIWNEDKSCCIVYNGELYNHHDLRPLLESQGHTFRTNSDTEVILHAYAQWGTKCLSKFIGMFAFAIWDGKQNTLFLARDRVGEKPLYYYQDRHRLVFASEIKAILADPSISREVNPRGLSNFLAFGHAMAPDTMFHNIRKLLPGHYLIVKEGHVKIEEYWDVGYEPQLNDGEVLTEEEYCEKIQELLNDSVRQRMISDVPLGAFLSGGIDSSVIVALMKKHASEPVKTFSLGFSVGGAYNELSDARKVAEHFGTEHHELEIGHVDLVNTLQTLVYHYDEPFADAASFPLYLLSQFARQHVKVILSGDGGDELFGGYRRYAADQLSFSYQRLPKFLINKLFPQIIDRLPRLRRFKKTINTLPIVNPAFRYASWLSLFTKEMQTELLQPAISDALLNYEPTSLYPFYYNKLRDTYAPDHLNQLMYVDFKTWLVDTYMEKTDKATMACGLEARLPILDHRLVELSFQIPSHYKIKGWKTKQIFKKAIKNLVPDFVLQKPKHGFSVPTDLWFRDDLKNFAFEILLDERTRRRSFFNNTFVEKIWTEHQKGRHVWDTQLWALLNFELWCRSYLDGDSP